MESKKASIASILLLVSLHFSSLVQVSSIDTLKQGETLNSTSELVSANGAVSLRFHTPRNSGNAYLALWYTGTSRAAFPVWIANRENPIPNNSNPILTLGARAELIITHDGGAPVEIYAGRSSQVSNATATLLDNGNFVVDSNGPAGLFWQSFDRPTDTLLPGMKLGVDSRAGRNWTLTSWAAEDDPAPGDCSLRWEPSERGLTVRRRGAVIWRSGELEYYRGDSGESRAEFENIDFGRDVFNFNFNFTSEVGEEVVLFSVLPFPGSAAQVVSGWRVEHDGDIVDIDRSRFIAQPENAAVARPAAAPGNAAAHEDMRAWIGFAIVGLVVELMLA